MKIQNLFKKERAKDSQSKIETLAKNQLEKLIGGGDGDMLTSAELKSKHEAAMAAIQNTR